MRPNCPLCGRHLSLEEARDRENTIRAPNGVEIVICASCGERKKELEAKLKGASPHQVEILKTKANSELIDAILREQTPPIAPKKDEHGCIIGVEEWNDDLHQCTKIKQPKSPEPKKDEYGCIIGVEKWNSDLHQCVKIEKHPPTQEQIQPFQPAPEVPARPVTIVGPVTIEQKVAALEDEIAKIKMDIANILGMLGQREARR